MEFTSQSAVSRPIVVKAELSMVLSNPVLLISYSVHCPWAESELCSSCIGPREQRNLYPATDQSSSTELLFSGHRANN